MRIGHFTDTHILAPHEVKGIRKLLLSPQKLKLKYQLDFIVLTGDIVDISNARKTKVGQGRELIRAYHSLHEHYIEGNHECVAPKHYVKLIQYQGKRVAILHGHTLTYSDEKIERWENKPGGRNRFKYFLYGLKHFFRKGKPLRMSNNILERLIDIADEYDADVIMWGHHHRVYRQKHLRANGKCVELINSPQGFHVYDIKF